MHTFFRGKVLCIMPKKYDEEFKARAVRLVTDHVEEYDSRTACVVAVAKRLGVAPETLRRWINQAEVDTGVRAGCPPIRCASCANSNVRTGSSSGPTASLVRDAAPSAAPSIAPTTDGGAPSTTVR